MISGFVAFPFSLRVKMATAKVEPFSNRTTPASFWTNPIRAPLLAATFVSAPPGLSSTRHAHPHCLSYASIRTTDRSTKCEICELSLHRYLIRLFRRYHPTTRDHELVAYEPFCRTPGCKSPLLSNQAVVQQSSEYGVSLAHVHVV